MPPLLSLKKHCSTEQVSLAVIRRFAADIYDKIKIKPPENGLLSADNVSSKATCKWLHATSAAASQEMLGFGVLTPELQRQYAAEAKARLSSLQVR